MTKNLLKEIMNKETVKKLPENSFSVEGLIQKLESGYTINNVPKFQQKKTFAPSTLSWNHGECPRYWYLAFDGATFEDNSNAFGVANRTNGTLSHSRIQDAMIKSGIAKVFKDDDGNDTTEFKIISNDPPVFGYGDGIIVWNDEEILTEIKTMSNEAFEYKKNSRKPKKDHLMQILIYMKILNKKRAVLIYENKNNHELMVIPVEVNDYYRSYIDQTFEWMRQVRQAWKNRTLPQKNYRSNSKICKQCPIQKTCTEAEEGTIKIKSLEGLSEDM